jgi:hypothetical protein
MGPQSRATSWAAGLAGLLKRIIFLASFCQNDQRISTKVHIEGVPASRKDTAQTMEVEISDWP